MPARNRIPEDPEARHARASRSQNSGFPVGLALGVVALIGLAYFGTLLIGGAFLGGAALVDRAGELEGTGGEAFVPFADLHEAPPDTSARSGARWVDNAPAGLAESSAAFAAARKLAAEGEQHLNAARAADAAGEASKARDFRKQAHTVYNQAFEDTALWEMEIEEKYSDRDRQVEKIKKERSRWMQKIIALHKTTGR